MVNLSIEIKRDIVNAVSAGNETKTAIAKRFETSVRTLNRVLKEHAAGVFQMEDDVEQSGPLDGIGLKIDSIIGDKPSSKPKSKTIDEKIDELVDELSYIITPVNVVFTYEDVGYTADVTHPEYTSIIQFLINGDGAKAVQLLDIATSIEEYMLGHVTAKGGVVKYKDLVIDGGLTRRIIEAMAEGDADMVHSLVAFFNNLMENPSNRAVNELYGFLEATDIKLTDDGHFLAYKKVDPSYKDLYTRTMDNSPGKLVSVPRNQVDEDSNRTCSYGLHVAAVSYMNSYGSCRDNRVVLCKVNPRDVVAVPSDYNNAKLRCCEYEVVKDVTDSVL